MQIELSKIHGAPNPIRETWDEEKMQELTESIRDLGVIAPIKVRPNSDGYEVVYGHRRTEAARRAGLSHIPAEIEGMDDGASVKQAIAENVVREDMSEIDKARAFRRLNDKDEYNVSIEDIAKFVGVSSHQIRRYIDLAEDPILDYVNGTRESTLHNIGGLANKASVTRSLGNVEDRVAVLEAVGTRSHVDVGMVSKAIRPLPKEDRHAVLDKAKRENLEPEQIERVANAVNQARIDNKPVAIESALAISGRAPMYEDMVRQRSGMMNFIERKDAAQKKKKQNEVEDYDQLVKEGIDYIRMLYTWMVDYAYEGIEQGKFSPEAARFVLKRFGSLITEYETNLKPSLEQIKE